MSFEDTDKNKLIQGLRESVIGQLASDFHELLDDDQIEHLREYRCLYVFHPKIFESRQRIHKNFESEEQQRVMDDFESLIRIIEMKKESRGAFEAAKQFFEAHFDESYHFPRLVDSVFFIKGDHKLEPVVFKLTTGLSFYEAEISLYDLVKSYQH